MKFSEAPDVTRGMYNVVETLRLDQLFVVCPGPESYPVSERVGVLSASHLPELRERVAGVELR